MKGLEVKEQGKKRIHLLDILRGAAIIVMLVDHIVFDIAFLFDSLWAAQAYDAIAKIAFIFSGTFVSVSGVCAALGRNTALRGAQLTLMGVGITLFTAFFMPELIILNDVLVLLGFCMLAYAVLDKYLEKLPYWLGITLFLIIFVITYNIEDGYIGIKGLLTLNLNEQLYTVDWLYPFGIHSDKFVSANYYPIFPWIFLFMAASYVGKLIKKNGAPSFAYKNFAPPVAFCGRNSLIIYIVHQPVLYGIIWVLSLILK